MGGALARISTHDSRGYTTEFRGKASPRYEYFAQRADHSPKASGWTGRSDRQRILRCSQLDDSATMAAQRPRAGSLNSSPARLVMETSSSAPAMVAWVGLDWADERHETRLQARGSSGIDRSP